MTNNPGTDAQNIFTNVFAFFGLLSSDGFLLDLEGEVFTEIGTAPELLVGHKFSETVFWQSKQHTAEVLQSAIDEAGRGIKSKVTLSFRVSAQKCLTVELSLIPRFDESKNVKEIFFCATDVSDKENEINYHKTRSEHLLYAAEAAEMGLWFWDLKADEIFSTPKCNEIYDLNPNEVFTYESFVASLHPEDSERVIAELELAQKTGEEFGIEYRIIHWNKSVEWLKLVGKTFFDDDGNAVSMMGVLKKITERKQTSDELTRATDNLRKARDEAEEANRAKDYFLAFVSHELRSPLNAILGWTKILLTKEIDEKIRKNALETIERSARAQAKLIGDLVDSSRIASGKLRLELRPANLLEIVQHAFDLQKPAAAAKHLQFEFESDAVQADIYGDSHRLNQVFTNLLTNALKFTPENGRVKIKIESNASVAKITVEDDGQGISPEALPIIFKQFAQADEKLSRDKSGLGLGLAIVKTLVEKHGGNIQAESAGLNRGAKFTVTLPLLATPANSAAENRENAGADAENSLKLDGVKILIVEDDENSREVLQIFLEQSGAQVKSAESAAAGRTMLAESNGDVPDVIISDIAMPIEDGYSFIIKVRNFDRKEISEIPAMALSAFASAENKEKAYDCGFQLYHTKPFEPDGLVKDILTLIKKR